MSRKAIVGQPITADAMPALSADLVQLRWLNLDEVAATATDEALLSQDERARADRFVTRTLRRRYITAHLFLRHVLAQVCRAEPAHLVFNENAWGKPSLENYPCVQFNLSHSQHMALLGVTRRAPIGVDIELVQHWPDEELRSLGQTIMTTSEQQALTTHPAASYALLTAWTRKEACVKALGLGLSYDVQRLEVGLEPKPCNIMAAANGDSLPTPCQLKLVTADGPGDTIMSVATPETERASNL